LAGILEGAGIGFSGRYNAPYGKDEFAAMPAWMCESDRIARFSLVTVPSKKHGGKGVPVTEQYHAFATSMTYPQTLQYLE